MRDAARAGTAVYSTRQVPAQESTNVRVAVVAVLVVEEPLLQTERAGLLRACPARSRQKARPKTKGNLFFFFSFFSSFFCGKDEPKGGVSWECNAECNGAFLTLGLVFYVQQALCVPRRSIDGRCLESTRAVPERSREPVSEDCITCARSM